MKRNLTSCFLLALLAVGCAAPAARTPAPVLADSPGPIFVVSPPATGPAFRPAIASVDAPATGGTSPGEATLPQMPTDSSRPPVKAVLIVQNHESDDFREALSNLGDRISERISGSVIRTIDPNDAIGVRQNGDPWGEDMPLSSAVRLAENLDAPALVTASVIEAAEDTPDRGRSYDVVMGLSLQAKSVPGGETLFGVTHKVRSEALLPEEMKTRRKAVYADLVERLVRETSAKFLAKARYASWTPDPSETVSVAFYSNLPGTDVLIDGVSYGTAGSPDGKPLVAKVSKGLHNLRFDPNAAGIEPYRQKLVKIQTDQTWTYVARENAEGQRLRLRDRKFDALLRNLEQGRATDDEIRKLVAQGYAKYLSSSHARLDGMPQSLGTEGLGLSPNLGLSGGSSTNGALEAVLDFDTDR